MVLFASKQLFCCGRIQRTRRRAYEKPYYLHAVQVNGDGASESGSNDKGKRGVGNGSKGGENDCEKKTKEGKGKDGCDNDGYDSVGKQKRSNKVGQFLLHFPFINQMKTSELEVESLTSDQRTNVVLLGKKSYMQCLSPPRGIHGDNLGYPDKWSIIPSENINTPGHFTLQRYAPALMSLWLALFPIGADLTFYLHNV